MLQTSLKTARKILPGKAQGSPQPVGLDPGPHLLPVWRRRGPGSSLTLSGALICSGRSLNLGFQQILQNQPPQRTHGDRLLPANSPASAAPYLAEEFTEIGWWMVVFQQRSDCLEEEEHMSVGIPREELQGVCQHTRVDSQWKARPPSRCLGRQGQLREHLSGRRSHGD